MSDFSELLQNAEQLTAEFDNVSDTFGGAPLGSGAMGSDLPRVDRSLKQLVEAGQQLFSKTKKDHAGINLGSQDVKASVLLGSRGVDLPGMTTRLDTLTAAVAGTERDKAFAPIEPTRDTDVAGFLKNERENAILSVIEETRRDTFENSERLHWESTLSEWEMEKQRILNDLAGGVCGSEMSNNLLSGTSAPKSTFSRIHDSTLGVRSPLDSTEMAYAAKVMAYNESIVKGGLRPDMVKQFSQLFPEEKDQEAALVWDMVDAMLSGLPPQPSTIDPTNAIKERMTLSTSKAIVSSARTYLERAFLKHVHSTVYSNLRQAELGGIPGTYQLVKSYLNVKVAPNTPGLEDGYLDGIGSSGAVPVWPMIYCSLRSGDLDAAIQAASEAGPGLAEMVKLLSEVKGSSDNRLTPHTENVVRIAYRRSVRACTDPYKRAVYCLLGACDPSDEHSEVATSLDDYLWIKLAQIREAATTESSLGGGSQVISSGSSPETLSLPQLQHLLMNEYGETHFNAFEQPVLYFQVLFLTGQFEAACDFLFRVGENFRAHAVHIGLSLHEARVLLTPSNIRAPLLTSSKDTVGLLSTSSSSSTVKQLNVARLVMLYVRKFEVTDPREALHYFYFLRSMKAPTPNGEAEKDGNLFTSCVSELVLESRQFDLLLGRILEDGSKAPGLIDKFGGGLGDNLSQKIISVVAKDSEAKGMFEDSIRLYDLANNHEKVIELLNKLLAQVVSEPSVPESRRCRLQRHAVEIACRYRSIGHTASHDATAAFFLLLDLMTFFDAFHAQLFKDALEIVSKVQIIPLQENMIDTMVATFRLLTDEVRRTIPDLLLSTMNILSVKYKESKDSSSDPLSTGTGSFASKSADGGKYKYLEELRDQARALITFAGMIPYRMPGDTNARLVQMEVLMN